MFFKCYSNSGFRQDTAVFTERLRHRKFPYEEHEIRAFEKEFREREEAKVEINESATEEEKAMLAKKIEDKVQFKLKHKISSNPILDYTDYNCALYLATRLAVNYAVLTAVFNEIKKDDPSFNPKTLFDFGSGLGTTMWVANEAWPKCFSEHFNVEACQQMIDISRSLLQLGKESNPLQFPGIFYREFLPVSSYIKYDLVVSAFSLLDLPTQSSRIHVIENLWEKTQDMLVLIEDGNPAGFAAILEARNFLLEKTGYDVTSTFHIHPEDIHVEKDNPHLHPTSHIVAPCPHHYPCPRQFTEGPILCNFVVPYINLDFGQQSPLEVKKHYYSYIVLRKGNKQASDVPSWPRIVQECKKRGEHVVCRLCAPDGKIHSINFTKAHHKGHLYRCARVSEHGDLLPVTVSEFEKEVEIRFKKNRKIKSSDSVNHDEIITNHQSDL
ncbi:RSM22-like protein: mitochondrial [Leptotrombidium deliense]|uniref:RSM22-like protein: mitochondrial n=1 Tax=Leptotrombidium deliense TaxID=299467 RepID=A0A443SB88_9ACAR|nr:RSM22-like protein: mitochondrial [Leptotrombidium deliense]